MKKLVYAVALLALAGCAPPRPVYDIRVWDQTKMKEVELSPRQLILAELECKELTRRHVAQIALGNWGGAEEQRVFVHCMEDRGYKFVNSEELKR